MSLDNNQVTTLGSHFSVEQALRRESLAECVEDALHRYFAQLGEQGAHKLYQMVMEEVERPLFSSVMQHTKGNQTRAAVLLGISRSTLRKKLALYQID